MNIASAVRPSHEPDMFSCAGFFSDDGPFGMRPEQYYTWFVSKRRGNVLTGRGSTFEASRARRSVSGSPQPVLSTSESAAKRGELSSTKPAGRALAEPESLVMMGVDFLLKS